MIGELESNSPLHSGYWDEPVKNVFHSGCYLNGGAAKWDHRQCTRTRAKNNLDTVYKEPTDKPGALKDGKQKVRSDLTANFKYKGQWGRRSVLLYITQE